MASNTNLTRAVSAEFLSRKLKSIATVSFLITAALLALSVWLVSKSAWWLVLVVIIVSWGLLLTTGLLVAYKIIKSIRPSLSPEQNAATKGFVDKLERVAEGVQTPVFFIFFRILFDLARSNKSGFIKELTSDSTTLHRDLQNLQKKF